MAEGNRPLSEKKKLSNQRYLNTLDAIKVRVPKGKKKELKDAATAAGMSLNAFILSAVEEKLRRTDGGEQNGAG